MDASGDMIAPYCCGTPVVMVYPVPTHGDGDGNRIIDDDGDDDGNRLIDDDGGDGVTRPIFSI